LSNVIAQIKNRNYKFVIYIDYLSFEEFEIEYNFLKAVIDGGVAGMQLPGSDRTWRQQSVKTKEETQ